MKRPLANKRPIGPILFSSSDTSEDCICEVLKSNERTLASLEDIMDKSRDAGKEVGSFIYKTEIDSEQKWFKTSEVVGEESEISSELMADTLSEVPENADSIVALHTHPSGFPGLSPQDVSLFIEFIDFLDANLVLSEYEGVVTLSGLEKKVSLKEMLAEKNVSKVELELAEITQDVLSGEISPTEGKMKSANLVEEQGIAETCLATLDSI